MIAHERKRGTGIALFMLWSSRKVIIKLKLCQVKHLSFVFEFFDYF